jgi:hypothetical protein
MKRLSKQSFDKATKYIKTNADAINLAWYAYNFEGMTSDEFMNELGKYQHENGGFGGLVYEFEYQGPCLKCTEHAFRYMFYLKEKPSADHPVIKKMMKYVLERYRPEIGCWGELLEPQVNDGEHVGWWTYGDEYPPIYDNNERVKKYSPNGQATLAAFIAMYSELVLEDLYKDIIFYPVEKILRYYDKASPLFGQSSTDNAINGDINVPYNLKCFQQFVTCIKDKTLADKLKTILCQNPTACMNLDKNVWVNDFENVPCDIIQFPDSFLYPVVKAEVEESLDALIDRQNENGAWHLSWRFGADDTFDYLQRLFEMHVTNLNLAELGRFGRIEK